MNTLEAYKKVKKISEQKKKNYVTSLSGFTDTLHNYGRLLQLNVSYCHRNTTYNIAL